MIFGEEKTTGALGCVLAHSVALAGKRRLRKGRVLTEIDLAALASAGIDTITVARLQEGDLSENDAAERLARALVPDPDAQQLIVTEAFTGRVNLLANGPGVAVLDVGALEAVNRVHPMITLATVPPHQQMRARGMVATIKIIAYAVSQTDVEKAVGLAHSAIRLAPPKLETVSLIITQIPGGAGDKGQQAIADRVTAFGLDAPTVYHVPHRKDALATVLAASKSDLTLILTGSATSDSDDVAPSAVRDAGGVVSRFGMPVDPGNLLFLGEIQSRPVIGLPGCARSPALNGADWVLSRVICGIPVTDEDIAAMGVGGLLKEIPTRPQPRAGK